MRIHSYVVDHDLGFAPNPFGRACSLAACKPQIRKYAQVGDILIGTGSKKCSRAGHLVYWMLVDEIVTFDAYWVDVRFSDKKPIMNGSLKQRHGDNIYHRDPLSDEFLQEDSFHSEPNGVLSRGNRTRDTGTTERVLLGMRFAYWGGTGPKIPEDLNDFVHRTQGHKNRFTVDRIEAMRVWLIAQPERGFLGMPTDWKKLGSG